MKQILSILSFMFVMGVGNAEAMKNIDVKGYGLPASKHASLEVKKQEAFASALVVGTRNIVEIIYKSKIQSIAVVKEFKVVSEKMLSTAQGTIKDFEIDSQTMIEGQKLLEDIISCNFKEQKIVVRHNKLVFPSIDFLNFPNWQSAPKAISGIDIRNIAWEWDKSIGDWACIVDLSYLFDPLKIKKEEKQKAKVLTFKYEKDNSGNLIFQTVTIEGAAYGGGDDTPDRVRKNALDDALRNAVEKTNGVYIQTLSEVKDTILTKDEIISQTLGVAKVLDKNFAPRFTSEGNYEITCTVTAKVPIMVIVAKD